MSYKNDQDPRFYNPERGVIGIFIENKSVFDLFKDFIRHDFFEHQGIRLLFAFMKKEQDNLDSWDAITFEEHVETESGDSIHDWVDVADKGFIKNDMHYQMPEQVIRGYLKLLNFRYIIRRLGDQKVAHQQRFEFVTQFMEDYQQIIAVKEDVDFDGMIDAALEDFKNPNTGPDLPFGFKQFDDAFGGWLRGDLTLIVAATGMSKTVLLHNLLMECIRLGKKIIIYDYEMSALKLIQRMIAMHYRIPLDWIMHKRTVKGKKPISIEQRQYVMDMTEDFRNRTKGLLIIRSCSNINEMERDICEFKPDIITVDTLQAFTDEHSIPSGKSQTDHVTFMARKLQSLSVKYNIAIGATSQVKKENQEQVPKLGDIYGSSGIQTNAANIIGVRDPYKVTKNKEQKHDYDASILKIRHGNPTKLILKKNSSIGLISEYSRKLSREEELEQKI